MPAKRVAAQQSRVGSDAHGADAAPVEAPRALEPASLTSSRPTPHPDLVVPEGELEALAPDRAPEADRLGARDRVGDVGEEVDFGVVAAGSVDRPFGPAFTFARALFPPPYSVP